MGKPLLLALYEAVFTLIFVLATPVWIHRRWHFPEEMRERFGILGRGASTSATPDPKGKPPVWFHAASLGEVEAAFALIESELIPEGQPVHLTVTSTSARARAEERLRGRGEVSFAPLDLPWLVDRFLEALAPSVLIILETELWPRMIWGCHAREIPVLIASGRLSNRRWRQSRALRCFGSIWERIAGAAVQTETDRIRFSQLGVKRITVCGNVKYRETAGEGARRPADRDRALLWVIGSLRRGEEAVLEVARELAGERVRVVLAPRHLREMDHWRHILETQNWTVQSRGERPDFGPDPDGVAAWIAADSATTAPPLLLIDLHGELQQWYALADLASVGGSWIQIGGHNLFEAVRAGCSVSFGPHLESVADVAAVLIEEEIGCLCASPLELKDWFSGEERRVRAERERAAHHATRRLAGAVERTRFCFEDLRPDLFGNPKSDPTRL